MSSVNIWKKFQGMIPSTDLIIVTVTADNSDGTYTVQNQQGQSFRVRGDSGYAVSAKVFIAGGKIEGAAPTYTADDHLV